MTDKRALVWSYFELMSSGRLDEALSLLNDSGTWWNLIDRVSVPMRDFKERIRVAAEQLPMTFTLHGAHRSGDTVVIEAESVATMPDGSTYNNYYCYVITMWSDTLLHVRVYPDTAVMAHMQSLMPKMREVFSNPK